MSGDLMRTDFINSLPQPIFVRLLGDKGFDWPVHDFASDTLMFRIDVCGLLEVKTLGDAAEFRDANGVVHDAEMFYADWDAQAGAA